MDRNKVRPSDWITLGGALIAVIGSFGTWYQVKLEFAGITVTGDSSNGWSAGHLGWFVALLSLAVAVFVVLRRFEIITIKLPVSDGVIVMAAGGLSVLIVLVRMVAKPDFAGLRWGIFLTLLGALAVMTGGLLRNAEPAQQRLAGNDDRS